jgi:hypothetical protein
MDEVVNRARQKPEWAGSTSQVPGSHDDFISKYRCSED